MSEPTKGRDYERLNDLRDAIIEAVRTQDGVGGIKAFAAYEDFIEAESRAGEALSEPPERFDRSWWHYADDCPVSPRAIQESRAGEELDVERLQRAIETVTDDIEERGAYVGDRLRAEYIAAEYAKDTR